MIVSKIKGQEEFPPRLFFSPGALACFRKNIENGRVDSSRPWYIAFQREGSLDKEFLSVEEHKSICFEKDAEIERLREVISYAADHFYGNELHQKEIELKLREAINERP